MPDLGSVRSRAGGRQNTGGNGDWIGRENAGFLKQIPENLEMSLRTCARKTLAGRNR
jgi:hypothetical protein